MDGEKWSKRFNGDFFQCNLEIATDVAIGLISGPNNVIVLTNHFCIPVMVTFTEDTQIWGKCNSTNLDEDCNRFLRPNGVLMLLILIYKISEESRNKMSIKNLNSGEWNLMLFYLS